MFRLIIVLVIIIFLLSQPNKSYSTGSDCSALCNSAYPDMKPGPASWYSTCCNYVQTDTPCDYCKGFRANYKYPCYYFAGPFKDTSSSCYGKQWNSDGCGSDFTQDWINKNCGSTVSNGP